jgi:phage antirepressor YoqD-like protein
MTARKLGNRLNEMAVMFYQSGQWLFYAKHQNKGYGKPRPHHFTKSDGSTGTNTITVLTETGRQFIHSLIVC